MIGFLFLCVLLLTRGDVLVHYSATAAMSNTKLVTTSCLEREEVGQAFQPLHASVHVVSEEEKIARCNVHTQLPHIIREKIEVLVCGTESEERDRVRGRQEKKDVNPGLYS